MFKLLFKCALLFFCLFCIFAMIQISFAIYYSHRTAKPEPAELVVVFPGDSMRFNSGIELIKDGLAPRFMVVNTTDIHLREILQMNGAPEAIGTLDGGISRSTFEDVYQTAKMIEENQLDSVIVVTSGYHMPRALFLLKVYLTISGQEVHIQSFPVKEEKGFRENLMQYSNEAIKLWGSTIEMTGHYLTGQLLLDAPSLKKIQTIFKKNLLL
jgi:uncharacterized SAM-binding protein YcdF (DUF218 family)